MEKTIGGREGNPDIEIQALYLRPAAEQPDTVAVPRELLDRQVDVCADAGAWSARKELRALLGKEGEA